MSSTSDTRAGARGSMVSMSRQRTVLAQAAVARMAAATLVLAVLWLAVAWAVGVP